MFLCVSLSMLLVVLLVLIMKGMLLRLLVIGVCIGFGFIVMMCML